MFFKTDGGERITVDQQNPNGEVVLRLSEPLSSYPSSFKPVHIAHFTREEMLEILLTACLEKVRGK